MPISYHQSRTRAWVSCRMSLVEVWKVIRQGDAVVFADTVGVGIQDAVVVEEPLSAFDVLGQAAVVCCGDVARGADDEVARRLACETVEPFGYQASVDGHRHGLGNGREGKEGVRVCAVLVLGAVFAEGGVGVGLVEDDALHEARERGDDLAIASGFQFGQGLGVYLEVPGIVGLAFFEDRLGGSDSIAAALEDDAVEKGLVSVVVGVAFVDGQFVGGELDDAVGARAQGGEVLIITARGRCANDNRRTGLG